MGCGQVGRRILEVLISEFRLYNTRETLKRVNIPLLASKLRRSQAPLDLKSIKLDYNKNLAY